MPKIIYEDEQLIVVDKPPKILVIPAPGKNAKTLTDVLNELLHKRGLTVNPVRKSPPNPESLRGLEDNKKENNYSLGFKTNITKLSNGVNAHPCHRLDYETSGLVIYAKGKKMQQAIMEQFHQQLVKKKYIAFVQGRLAKEESELKSQIEGKSAITHYRIVERRSNFTVVRVETITGRTNQIRIQFKQIGHPLVGERRFAFARDYVLKFRRAALHAAEISFTHPVTGKLLSFHSDLPDDMKVLLNCN